MGAIIRETRDVEKLVCPVCLIMYILCLLDLFQLGAGFFSCNPIVWEKKKKKKVLLVWTQEYSVIPESPGFEPGQKDRTSPGVPF